MTTLHMDTEQVRQIANRMRDTSSQILTVTSSMRSTAGRLSAGWQGGNADRYLQSFSNMRRGCENQVQSLEDLAARISREADEWESVDNQSGFKNAFPPTGVIGPGSGISTSNDTNDDGFLSTIENMLDSAGLGADAGTIAAMILLIKQFLSEGMSAAEIAKALEANPGLQAAGQLGDVLTYASGLISFISMVSDDLNHYQKPQEIAAAVIVDALFVGLVTGLSAGGDDLAIGAIGSGILESMTGAGIVAGLPSIAIGIALYAGIGIDDWLINAWFPTSSVHDSLIQMVANALAGGGSGGSSSGGGGGI